MNIFVEVNKMKVILKQDIKALGKKDSMVEVSDGYGRNYLLPRGMAVEASSTNINEMKTKATAEKNKKDRASASIMVSFIFSSTYCSSSVASSQVDDA